MKVAVVILNWNGMDFLRKFLPSVIEHSLEDADIYVADNCSTDDSISVIENEFKEVRIIRNDKNYGFAGGYNVSLQHIRADYYILLNSDIEVTSGWIKPVIRLMESDKSIAACQPRLLSYHEKDKFEYAGAAGGFIDKYGYPFCRGRLFQTIETDTGQFNDNAEIFWATGACMFVRAPVYRELGGLDERFFAHMEEIDFCWRAKMEGYRIMYCPGSTVYHVGGGTLPKRSSRKTFFNMRNNNIMLLKNLPSNRLVKVFIARLFLDGIAAFKFLVDGGISDFFAVIRAHLHFYRYIPQIIKERKKRNIKPVTCIYNSNLVFDYFLKGRKKFNDLNPTKFS